MQHDGSVVLATNEFLVVDGHRDEPTVRQPAEAARNTWDLRLEDDVVPRLGHRVHRVRVQVDEPESALVPASSFREGQPAVWAAVEQEGRLRHSNSRFLGREARRRGSSSPKKFEMSNEDVIMKIRRCQWCPQSPLMRASGSRGRPDNRLQGVPADRADAAGLRPGSRGRASALSPTGPRVPSSFTYVGGKFVLQRSHTGGGSDESDRQDDRAGARHDGAGQAVEAKDVLLAVERDARLAYRFEFRADPGRSLALAK